MSDLSAALARTRTFVLDVDGVLTDGTILVSENGDLLRRMHIQDGYALQAAVRAGYRVCVITGGSSDGVRKRLARLGVVDFYSGVRDKTEVLVAYAERHGLDLAEALYVGDDLPDLGPMRRVGLACAPANARPEVIAEAHYVSPLSGGEACVRDLIERVLKLNGQWPAA